MAEHAYIYALVGNQADAQVLRYEAAIETPLPGSDVPTTHAVGPLVVESVAQDDSGRPVVIAYDSTPTRDEVAAALAEGWEQPPADDPWAPMVPGSAARVHPS
jgi:hypothetical protein